MNFKVFFIAVASRLFLFLAAYSGPKGSLLSFLNGFANRWDGPHYLFIAQHGYVATGIERLFIVFPPLYPLLVKISDIFLHNLALTAIIVSNILFVLGSLCFYKLLRLDYSEKFSLTIVFLFSIFPTTYFFSTSYAESLFLLLCCGAFLFARQGKFLAASIFAGLATLTKPFGLIIWPILLVEWWQSHKRSSLNLLSIFTSMISSVGIYLFINYLLFRDFFAFQKFLQINWFKTFAPPWVGIIESWKRVSSNTIIVGFAEAITASISWILAVWGFTRWAKMRFSYALYVLLGVLFFTSTGFILSSPRYLLSLPPFFIILTKITDYKLVRIIWISFSLLLLLYLSRLFAQGQWAF